ncbi:MAG: hypothetical protein HY815_32590, partial [Candidatus Riflebacteria bacterium]|nr:hypothetical protein [Candidatus Riflebacteria bacterium]
MKAIMAPCGEHALIVLDGPTDIREPELTAAGPAYEVFDGEQVGEDLLLEHDPRAFKKAQKAKAKAEKKEAEEAEEEEEEGEEG